MKQYLLILALPILVTACGGGLNGPIGATGAAGPTGAAGSNGSDGLSLVVDVQVLQVDDITCNQTNIYQDVDRDNVFSELDVFSNGFLTCDGAVGANGADGADGEDGEDGAQGEQGEQGEAGLSADLTYAIVSVFDPCGPSGGYDEVILKLGNGKYISSFSENANGKNTRFVMLSSGGSYVTTDGTNCAFTLP